MKPIRESILLLTSAASDVQDGNGNLTVAGLRPISKKNIVSLDGDITKPELGLSETERELVIDNVSVVFHCAASVKFDAPLK